MVVTAAVPALTRPFFNRKIAGIPHTAAPSVLSGLSVLPGSLQTLSSDNPAACRLIKYRALWAGAGLLAHRTPDRPPHPPHSAHGKHGMLSPGLSGSHLDDIHPKDDDPQTPCHQRSNSSPVASPIPLLVRFATDDQSHILLADSGNSTITTMIFVPVHLTLLCMEMLVHAVTVQQLTG